MHKSQTIANKAFIAEMIGSKRSLEDYPDRYDPSLLMHEPASLPFGGVYRGLADFKRFYPLVREFYDFDRFELLGVHGDGEIIFATIRAGLKDSAGQIFLAEQFHFEGQRIVEVRLHICDDGPAAAMLDRTRHSRVVRDEAPAPI